MLSPQRPPTDVTAPRGARFCLSEPLASLSPAETRSVAVIRELHMAHAAWSFGTRHRVSLWDLGGRNIELSFVIFHLAIALSGALLDLRDPTTFHQALFFSAPGVLESQGPLFNDLATAARGTYSRPVPMQHHVTHYPTLPHSSSLQLQRCPSVSTAGTRGVSWPARRQRSPCRSS